MSKYILIVGKIITPREVLGGDPIFIPVGDRLKELCEGNGNFCPPYDGEHPILLYPKTGASIEIRECDKNGKCTYFVEGIGWTIGEFPSLEEAEAELAAELHRERDDSETIKCKDVEEIIIRKNEDSIREEE